MQSSQADLEIGELISYKVRKRVAKKVLKDIHQQVDDIEQQVQAEHSASKILIPLLLLLAGIIISMYSYWTDVIRLLSGFIN